MTTCSCGAINWHGGVLSLIDSQGIRHFPEGFICFDTGGDWFAMDDTGVEL